MKLISFDALEEPNADGDRKFTKEYVIWGKALADLSCDEIDNGLIKAKDYENNWLTANAFRKLCKFTPEDIGLPDAEMAYKEACNKAYPKHRQEYSSPIVYLAGQQTGFWDLDNKPERLTFPTYKKHYNALAKRLLAGEEFKIQAAIKHEKGRGRRGAFTEKEIAAGKKQLEAIRKRII